MKPINQTPNRSQRTNSAFSMAVLLAFVVCFMCQAPARATTVVAPTFPELVQESDLIVRARCKTVSCVWVDTPQGKVIKTDVTFEVLRTLKGRAQMEITLRFLGGEIDDQVLSVSGMPQFSVGQTDIVFVSGNRARFCPLVGMMHGRYKVKTDAATGREFITRNDDVPLADVSEVQANQSASALIARLKPSESALTSSVFEQQIQSEVNRRAALP